MAIAGDGFSVAELANISASLLDYYVKGEAFDQIKQDHPTWKKFAAKKKNFPGGKGLISIPVRGTYQSTVEGFTVDDTVTFTNPTPVIRGTYKWFEHHTGLKVSLTELKEGGISVTDTSSGWGTSNHAQKDMVVLTDLLGEKIYDMLEGYAKGMANLLWGDGTGDAKALAGIRAFLTDTPATGTIGGIDASAKTYWRHTVDLAINSTTEDLGQRIQEKIRLLSTYGGKPDIWACGSDFLSALERQLRSGGYYSNTGFAGRTTDISVGSIAFQGKEFYYDPDLDANSMSKYCFAIDSSKLQLYAMDQEWEKAHFPSRPHDKFVIYRSLTTTCGLVMTQRNAHAIFSIA